MPESREREHPSQRPQRGSVAAMHAVTGAPLFDQTVSACALSPLLAGDVIRRACVRAGVDADALSTDELRRALPSIRKALGVFLVAEQVDASMARIQALLSG